MNKNMFNENLCMYVGVCVCVRLHVMYAIYRYNYCIIAIFMMLVRMRVLSVIR